MNVTCNIWLVNLTRVTYLTCVKWDIQSTWTKNCIDGQNFQGHAITYIN
jgi:hypothetical protein